MSTTGHKPIDRLIGAYGQSWRHGIISDHLHYVDPTRIRVLTTGRPVVVDDDGSAIDVLCSEVVWIIDEDGRSDGRCGANVISLDVPTCPGHRYLIDERATYLEPGGPAWQEDQLERMGAGR